MLKGLKKHRSKGKMDSSVAGDIKVQVKLKSN